MRYLFLIALLIGCGYPKPTIRTPKGVGLYSTVSEEKQKHIDETLSRVCDCAHVDTWDCYRLFDIKIYSAEYITEHGSCHYLGWEECAGQADFDREEIWITPDLSALAHEAGHFYEMARNGRKSANTHNKCTVQIYCGNASSEIRDIDDCVEVE